MKKENYKYFFKGNLDIMVNKSELSRKTEISYPTIVNIINCKQKCNKPYAFIIAHYLGKPLEYYFDSDENNIL